jgi:hypothetical protein
MKSSLVRAICRVATAYRDCGALDVIGVHDDGWSGTVPVAGPDGADQNLSRVCLLG